MAKIHFEAKPYVVGDTMILRLPAAASDQLPSRGQVMVEGKVNGFAFQAPLEPDGKASHWLKVDAAILQGAKVKAGETAKVDIEVSQEWPEPKVPTDILSAVKGDAGAASLWTIITPMARWDWIRWIGGTANPDTRKKRIEVALSKMNKGERRPCCFNRGMCMEPTVSKGGVLFDSKV